MKWDKYRLSAIKLLRARNKKDAVDSLVTIPFILNQGISFFVDEFDYFLARCDLDVYVKLAEEERTLKATKDREIANTLLEIGLSIRFIGMKRKEKIA